MIDSKQFIQEHESIIFEALNDYKRWFDDGNDKDKDIEKLETINNAIADLQQALTTEAEYFSVNSISKDDLKSIFEDKNVGHKEIMEQIDNLTEDDLKEIASKTADGICDSGSYSMALENAFEVWSDKK